MLAAIAAGALRAGIGIRSARKQSRQNGRLIRAAYERAQRDLGTRQGDIRQDTTESLNARGILNGGSGTGMTSGDRFTNEGRIGETGSANTLGGQVQRDLSEEFRRERGDLWAQRQSGIKQNRLDTMNNYIGAVSAGIQVGSSFASGMPGAGGLSAAQAATAAAPSMGTGMGPVSASQMQGPIAAGGIRGAFGLSPVDGSGTPQIGVAQPGTDGFNFHL
jgi:type II secretory pathway pseudopilin PulG